MFAAPRQKFWLRETQDSHLSGGLLNGSIMMYRAASQ
jgi:hypothetical protein